MLFRLIYLVLLPTSSLIRQKKSTKGGGDKPLIHKPKMVKNRPKTVFFVVWRTAPAVIFFRFPSAMRIPHHQFIISFISTAKRCSYNHPTQRSNPIHTHSPPSTTKLYWARNDTLLEYRILVVS